MSPRLEHAPKFWTDETSGTLQPAVRAYLTDATLTEPQIAAMRAYLRQWIQSPLWEGPGIQELRRSVDQLHTRAAIAEWVAIAVNAGLDPL
jgi:hypothetical protein